MTSPDVPNPFAEFVERYRHDPVGFVVNVLGAEPDDWQIEALEDVFIHGTRQISIRSGHGVGKSALLAWIAVIAMCVFPAAKIIQTAPSGPQLWDALFAETCMWFKRLPEPIKSIFDVQTERIVHKGMPEECFVSARTSRAEKPEAMQGVHAEHGIVILMADEASGIPEEVFDAGSGSMSGHNCVTILTGNPTRTSGLFFDTHHKLRGLWKTRRVSCVDSPRVSRKYLEEQLAKYGSEDDDRYRVRVLGEFPKRDSNVLISLELVEAAMMRDIAVDPMADEVWGVDVARFGDDSNALCKRRGKVVLEKTRTWSGMDTMSTVGIIKKEFDDAEIKPKAINIDVIGIGAGVVDRCIELGLPVFGVNVSEAPAIRGGHVNLRAELWDTGKEWFEALDCRVCNDQDLTGELCAPRYKFVSSGKMQLESKDEMKKRKVPSPNRADAFMLTLANDAIIASGQSGSQSGYMPRKTKGAIKRNLKGVV